jgi:polysaccharide chain length determinant protein (PEP-CTERM system associated)
MKAAANESVLEQLIEVCRRRSALILAVFFGALVPGVTFVKALPNVYRSTATMLVEPGGQEGSATGELEARLSTIHLEILSRARLVDLIQRFDLYPKLRPRVSGELLAQRMRRDIQVDLKGAENPTGPGPTVSFTLSYRGRDPQTVAKVANTLGAFYLEEDLKIRERHASGTVQVLGSQLEETRKRLEDRERRLAEFQDQNLGELPQQTDLNLATLSRLSEQLRVAIDERTKLVERRETLARRLAEAQATSSEPDGVAARVARLNADLQELRQRFSDKYPDVIRLKGEIAALERQAEEARRQAKTGRSGTEGDRALLALKESLREAQSEIARAKAEEDRIRREIAAYSRRLENAPRRQLAFQEVWRDYQTTKELYNSLLKRYEEAQLAEGTEQDAKRPRFRILDAAVPPTEPIAPNRMQLLAMVFVLALAMTAGAVFGREQHDLSFHGADDLRAFASVPVVVTVPRVVTRSDAWRRKGRALAVVAATLVGIAVASLASYQVGQGNERVVFMLTRGRS